MLLKIDCKIPRLLELFNEVQQSINDVSFEEEKGGSKSGLFGQFSRLNWSDRGREDGQKTQKSGNIENLNLTLTDLLVTYPCLAYDLHLTCK